LEKPITYRLCADGSTYVRQLLKSPLDGFGVPYKAGVFAQTVGSVEVDLTECGRNWRQLFGYSLRPKGCFVLRDCIGVGAGLKRVCSSERRFRRWR